MFLKFSNRDKSIKDLACTTRSQFKAAVKHSPSLEWKLENNESPIKSKAEERYESQKNTYDSDGSESILSQEIQTDPLVPLKNCFNLVHSKEANLEKREKKVQLTGIQETRTFGAMIKETDTDKNSGKDFIFRLKEWGDWTAKSEDMGRFFFVHQSPSLLKKFRALVDEEKPSHVL